MKIAYTSFKDRDGFENRKWYGNPEQIYLLNFCIANNIELTNIFF